VASDAADAIGVLDRMTAILEAFDEDDRGLRLSELAMRADLPKSTVSRLVSTLVRQRYLERNGTVIHLGLRLFELGQLAEQPRELRAIALPVMADLRNTTGETVHLAIRDGHEMVCIGIMRGHGSAMPTSRIGGRIPAHATALGKAMLAYSDKAEVDAVLSAGLTRWTPHTVVEPDRLMAQLAEVRLTGLAAEQEEFAVEVCGVASPVFSPSRRLVAAISVSGRVGDFDPDRSAPPVRAAAVALTRRHAAAGPPRPAAR
jgi:IclR family acetate operon transcriptional repressor